MVYDMYECLFYGLLSHNFEDIQKQVLQHSLENQYLVYMNQFRFQNQLMKWAH